MKKVKENVFNNEKNNVKDWWLCLPPIKNAYHILILMYIFLSLLNTIYFMIFLFYIQES
jgi:hypothetical protein